MSDPVYKVVCRDDSLLTLPDTMIPDWTGERKSQFEEYWEGNAGARPIRTATLPANGTLKTSDTLNSSGASVRYLLPP